MGPGYAVRSILHHDQASSLDQLAGTPSRGRDWQNPVRIAVNHQCRNINAGKVIAEVLMPSGYACKTRCCRSASGEIPASLDGLFADALAQQQVRVVEVLEEFGEERIAICSDGFLDPLEDAAIHALWIVVGLQQVWRDAGDDHRFAHTLRSVFPQVARHFAATHREADQRKIMQLEVRHYFVQVCGESVVVVTRGGLAGLSESPAVIGDDSVTCSKKHRDLFLP